MRLPELRRGSRPLSLESFPGVLRMPLGKIFVRYRLLAAPKEMREPQRNGSREEARTRGTRLPGYSQRLRKTPEGHKQSPAFPSAWLQWPGTFLPTATENVSTGAHPRAL